ncbi:hypothetical protein ACA910_005482 [Epithemia clementina (nom. ined.)]
MGCRIYFLNRMLLLSSVLSLAVNFQTPRAADATRIDSSDYNDGFSHFGNEDGNYNDNEGEDGAILSAAQQESDKADGSQQCGVYFAPTTIPGAGNGLFAGKSFDVGNLVTPGDLIVPIADFAFHNNKIQSKQIFLWNEYTWHHRSFLGAQEEANEIYAASFGIGAAINCNFALNNMEYEKNKIARSITANPTQAKMGSHPGAGASTALHGLVGYAAKKIPAGMELFLSYGEGYFNEEKYDGVPRSTHFKQGQKLLRRFSGFRRSFAEKVDVDHKTMNISDDAERESTTTTTLLDPEWMVELYDLTVHTLQGIWDSTVLKTLPDDIIMISEIVTIGVEYSHYNESIRSLDWLTQHGSCADNLQEGISTIPFAERGAFIRRRIAKGETVAPAPLIHIHPKSMFNMHKPLYKDNYVRPTEEGPDRRNVTEQPYHQQLLLNYCFGHGETDLLLCPYGIGTALINHSRERANVKIIWSDKHMLHPEWQSMKPSEWAHHSYSGLAWEYIATRDLLEGEEVLLDYGEDWERAWSQHVASWLPPTANCTPISAFDLNKQHADLKIPTAAEGLASFSLLNDHLCDSTAMPNQHFPTMECQVYYLESWWLDEDYDYGKYLHPCRPIDRFQNKVGQNLYIVQVLFYREANLDEDDEYEYEEEEEGSQAVCGEFEVGLLFGVPGDIFYFTDRPYTRDSAQPWSFRHEMGIPNELLPPAWRETKIVSGTRPSNTTGTCQSEADSFVNDDEVSCRFGNVDYSSSTGSVVHSTTEQSVA